MRRSQVENLVFHPLTLERWSDFEYLFGKQGACAGCWCMWWRLTRSQFSKQAGSQNKRAMKRIVRSGAVPGILAYANGDPVGWCSIAPRTDFPALERSPVLKRVDDRPVWSVVCFYVAKRYRKRGLMAKLLEAAVQYAKKQGAEIVEGYPIRPKRVLAYSDGFTGIVSTFRRAGFVQVENRSSTRPIMRYTISS